MRRRAAMVAVLGILAVSLAGCLDPYRPHVPDQVVATAADDGREWQVEESAQEDHGVFGPNLVETEYRFDPSDSGAPYPGMLLLLGVRTLTRLDSGELLERTREVLEEALADQGVAVDRTRDREGERTLANGARTQWFVLEGTSESGSTLFQSEEEVRALGEAWFDGRSNTAIIAVAMSQTTGSTLLGGTDRDHTTWNELVGDPSGSVGGAIHDHGFIYNTVSHG